MCEVSLVVPCYLDAPHLRASAGEILSILEALEFSYEVIFVDDCSPDRCNAIIDAIIAEHPDKNIRKITHAHNTGRGGAVTSGFEASRGEVVGYIDVDLEVHARYIPAFVMAVKDGAPVVTAERIYKLSAGLLHRAALSRAYLKLVQQTLQLPLPDTEAGYKFFDRPSLMTYLPDVQDTGWFWDTEILARAAMRGLNITTIPTLFIRRRDKHSTVRVVRDSLDYFVKLMRFRRTLRED